MQEIRPPKIIIKKKVDSQRKILHYVRIICNVKDLH